jgi:hypothetical protein
MRPGGGLLCLLAGLLLVLIFPWYNVEWLAWLAFVPLLMATRGVGWRTALLWVDQRLCGLSGHSALDSAHDDQLRRGSHTLSYGLLVLLVVYVGLYVGVFTAGWT